MLLRVFGFLQRTHALLLQARALIVNGGTLFSPCPHLFFRRGTRRPTAVRLQKEEPHTPSPLARRRRKFCKWHSLHVDFAGNFGRTRSWTHSSTRPTFALGILTQSLQNLGFEAAPKERMMLTARLPLRNGDHPSQDSLRKLKKWRPPWRFLFS